MERNTALAHASCVIPARLRAPRQSTRNIPPPPFAPTPESSDNTFRRPHTGASVWNQIPVLGARTGSARLDAEPFEPAQYSGLADTEDAADLRDGLVLLLVQAGKELVDRLAVDVL